MWLKGKFQLTQNASDDSYINIIWIKEYRKDENFVVTKWTPGFVKIIYKWIDESKYLTNDKWEALFTKDIKTEALNKYFYFVMKPNPEEQEKEEKKILEEYFVANSIKEDDKPLYFFLSGVLHKQIEEIEDETATKYIANTIFWIYLKWVDGLYQLYTTQEIQLALDEPLELYKASYDELLKQEKFKDFVEDNISLTEKNLTIQKEATEK